MNLLQHIQRPRTAPEERGLVALSTTMAGSPVEPISYEFAAYVQAAYKANGIVFAVILARMLLFSEARFRFRSRLDGTLTKDDSLRLLEVPWPGGTTRDMLARMEQDASLAGNAFIYKASPTRLQRLRPDWVEIILDAETSERAGYLYTPGGKMTGGTPIPLGVDEVAHYAPIPDPVSTHKGMSWLTPVLTEIESDKQMTAHRQKFFENAATPNLLVTVEKRIKDKETREQFRDEIDRRYGGYENAYRTLILDDGADAKAIGNTFEQMNFTTVQAAGENRIAAAGGVPSIVVGLKEGLQAATYSNYAQAMRRFAEMTMHPNWGSAAGDLAVLVKVPAGSELWYDAEGIPALKQDELDAAAILQRKALTAATLIRVGYKPDQVGPALGLPAIEHTGQIPVTLYPDGQNPEAVNPKQAPEDQAAPAQ